MAEAEEVEATPDATTAAERSRQTRAPETVAAESAPEPAAVIEADGAPTEEALFDGATADAPPADAPPADAPPADAPAAARPDERPRRSREQAARKSSPVEGAAAAVADAAAGEAFALERAELPALRTVRGRVVDAGGAPLVGARVEVEGHGAVVLTDDGGAFELSVPTDFAVAAVGYDDYETVRFDLTDGDDFRVALARRPGALSRVSLAGVGRELAVVAPVGERYPAFERYVDSLRAGPTADSIVVQFDVSRAGRPRQVAYGPGVNSRRRALRRARQLLEGGPDWPEPYRRRAWRYTVRW